MDAAGNEVWEWLTSPSISRCTRIGTATTYKVKTLVATAIFRGNTVFVALWGISPICFTSSTSIQHLQKWKLLKSWHLIFWSIFFHDMVGSLLSIFPKVIRMFVNGAIIKVYKYGYKYNRVGFQSGLGGLVVQPVVWAISLCWLGWLVFNRVLACLGHCYTCKCQKCSIAAQYIWYM